MKYDIFVAPLALPSNKATNPIRHRLNIYLCKSVPTMTSVCACVYLCAFSYDFFLNLTV